MIRFESANSALTDEDEEASIIQQLTKFGYEEDEIVSAIKLTPNKRDINDILDTIRKQQNTNPQLIYNSSFEQPVKLEFSFIFHFLFCMHCIYII